MSLEGYEWKRVSQVLKECPSVEASPILSERYPGYQGIWCRYYWALINSIRIEGCVVVGHGPLGCNSSARTFYSSDHHLGHPFLHIPTTNLNNNDVIMGGEEKLENTLLQVDRDYNPSLIIVHTNCCAGLIMDDVPGVIDRVKDQIKARIAYVPSEGFTTCLPGEALDKTLPFYVDIMDPPEQVRPRTVNILGNAREPLCAWEDAESSQWEFPQASTPGELKRYIEALDLKLHRVVFSGDVEYLRTAPEAAVNAFHCQTWGYPVAWEMKKRFGTPHLRHGEPIGLEATSKWINELADFFGERERAGRFISQEYAQVKGLWEKAKAVAKGRVAIIEASRNAQNAANRPLANARFAMEMGMTPYIINIAVPMLKAKEFIVKYWIEEGVDPLMLAGPHAYGASVNILEALKDLGLSIDEVVYFPHDVLAYHRAGTFDPSLVPQITGYSQSRRVRHRPRYIGFRGTEVMCQDLIQATQAAQRKARPTFYGRIYGQMLESTGGKR